MTLTLRASEALGESPTKGRPVVIWLHPVMAEWNGSVRPQGGELREMPAPTAARNVNRYVVIAQAPEGGPVRITAARNWRDRMRQLREQSGARLRLVALLHGDGDLAARLHWQLARSRVRGEWYSPKAVAQMLRALPRPETRALTVPREVPDSVSPRELPPPRPRVLPSCATGRTVPIRRREPRGETA